MNQDSEVIVLLCSRLCPDDETMPLQPREWSVLAQKLQMEHLRPGYLLMLGEIQLERRLNLDPQTARRYRRLLDRTEPIRQALSLYADMGIYPVTRADSVYPKTLKRTLGNRCPPFFYCAGNPELLNIACAGYTGVRRADMEDITFTRSTVMKTLQHGYGVVTGGAVGVDQTAAGYAFSNGGSVVEYPAGQMFRRMQNPVCAEGIRSGKWLLVSISEPDVPFRTPVAMMRNQLIYAHSHGTVVVHAELERGGTWAGAMLNLRKKYCPCFCRDCRRAGNRALIAYGAIPVTDEWDGNISAFRTPSPDRISHCPDNLSLYPDKISHDPDNLSLYPDDTAHCPDNLSCRPDGTEQEIF